MSKMLKIAIDYDGTFMENPKVYTEIVNLLLKTTYIGIITGRSPSMKDQDIVRVRQYGIDWLHFWYSTDMMNDAEKRLINMIKNKELTIHRDEVVCMWKARMCEEKSIDILIDDAADKIRLYMSPTCKTIILKHPTAYNETLHRWDNSFINYELPIESITQDWIETEEGVIGYVEKEKEGQYAVDK